MNKMEQIRQIIEDLRSRGENLTEDRIQQLTTKHSDLMPELERELRNLTLIPVEPLSPPLLKIPDEEWSDLGPGDMVATYKVLERLGRGGMGVVYLVEETKPIHRQVALKMMLGRLGDKQSRARFEAERQALARMNHANIATIYEANTTEQGHPYFLMEYVKGGQITTYCDNNSLDVSARLELFLQICQGILHAHQKGVVHRDIKPSNILVMIRDGKAAAKIIDFGLAKSLVGRLTDDTCHTAQGQLLGTYEYMSPEQVRKLQDVDTRTDIFSLGVLLYQLMIDELPFGARRDGVANHEIQHRILNEQPSRVSHRIRDLVKSRQEDAVRIAKSRGTNPELLVKRLREDLDWIILMALEKDQTKRYQTITELAADIQRHLDHEPVHATKERPWFYEARKFYRRHNTVVLSGLAIGLVFVVAAVTVAWLIMSHSTSLAVQRNIARSQRDRARTAYGDLAQITGQFAGLTADTSSKTEGIQLYEEAVTIAEELVHDNPDTLAYRRSLATALNSVASLYSQTGQPKEAESAYRRAVELQKKVAASPNAVATDQQFLAGACGDLGNFLQATGRPDQASEYLLHAQQLQEKLFRHHPEVPGIVRDLASTYRHLALTLAVVGRIKDAEALNLQALQLQEKLHAQHPNEHRNSVHLGATLNNLANLYTDTARPELAEETFRRAIKLQEELVKVRPRITSYQVELAKLQNNLGTLLADLGQNDKAEEAFRAALEIRLTRSTAEPGVIDYQHDLAGTLNNLGLLSKQMGRYDDAAVFYSQARNIRQKLAEAELPQTELLIERVAMLNNIGNFYLEAGEVQKADEAFLQAVSLTAKLIDELPEFPQYQLELSKAHNNRGVLYDSLGEWDKAETTYKEAIRIRRTLAEKHPTVTPYQELLATALGNLGAVYHHKDLLEESKKAYCESIAILDKLVHANPTRVDLAFRLIRSHNNLATLYGKFRRYDEAKEAFGLARELCKDVMRLSPEVPEYWQILATIMNGQAVTLQRIGQRLQARSEYESAVEIAEQLSADHPLRVDFAASLGLYYGNMGDICREPARPQSSLDWYKKSISVLQSLHNRFPQDANVREYLLLSYAKRAEFQMIVADYASSLKDWNAAIELDSRERDLSLRMNQALCLARLKDHVAAVSAAETLAMKPGPQAGDLYDLACVFSLASAAVRDDMQLSVAERESLTEAYSRRAVEMLQQARTAGFFQQPGTSEHLQQDADLDALRSRADYLELVTQLGSDSA